MILLNRPKGLGRAAAEQAVDAAEALGVHLVEEHVGYRESPVAASCEDVIAVELHAALYRIRG